MNAANKEFLMHHCTFDNKESLALYEAERKAIFEEIRHYVATKHKAPQHVLLCDLKNILALLKGE